MVQHITVEPPVDQRQHIHNAENVITVPIATVSEVSSIDTDSNVLLPPVTEKKINEPNALKPTHQVSAVDTSTTPVALNNTQKLPKVSVLPKNSETDKVQQTGSLIIEARSKFTLPAPIPSNENVDISTKIFKLPKFEVPPKEIELTPVTPSEDNQQIPPQEVQIGSAIEQLYTEIFEENPDLLQLARQDLGIKIEGEAPAPTEQVIVAPDDLTKTVLSSEVNTSDISQTDNAENYSNIDNEVTAQIIDEIHHKIYELEPILLPKVEETFIELRDALEEIIVFEFAIDAVVDDAEARITEIVRELCIILEVDDDDAKLSNIVNALIVQRLAAHKIMEVRQLNDEGTHEATNFAGSFFYQFKQLLDPVYIRLGRAVLSTAV